MTCSRSYKPRPSNRALKKKDKKAAAILLALTPEAVSKDGFGLADGRYVYSWRCSYEYDEWDTVPATDFLEEKESWAHIYNCIDPETGDLMEEANCPPSPVSAMKQLPSGWRWRGARLVRVGPRGEMLKEKGDLSRLK